MDTSKMQALYGLKWHPFTQEVPVEGLYRTTRIDSFCFRLESLVIDGGFAMVTGDPGAGKSVALRILADRLSTMRELTVGSLTRPQSRIADFYREISQLFGFAGSSSNRWVTFKTLRERWQSHIESTLFRPVLLIDEAQEMPTAVLSEIRLLGSMSFDSRQILTVVLCGDERLPERLRKEDLLPLGSRIKTKLKIEPASREELVAMMKTRIEKAGNPAIMTPGLIDTLVEHAGGNPRSLLQTAEELFASAMSKELRQMDEKLFFDLYPLQETKPRRAIARRA